MEYKLVKSSDQDKDRLIDYKKKIIYEYAKDLKKEEIDEINRYAISEVHELFDDYYNIIADNKNIGCLLITKKDNKTFLDEIYLEEKYRNKGIGTNIIKNVLNKNDIVYLWVYKDNKKAISLYKKIGFNIIEETEYRYYMKFINKKKNQII